PKVDDVSLVDGVFDGAFDGDGGRILLWEKGRGEEKCSEGGEEHGEGDYLTRMDMINEVKHEMWVVGLGEERETKRKDKERSEGLEDIREKRRWEEGLGRGERQKR
ncbi:hypothetical protein Tco_1049852, partial [Tanacetum coccineum]